MRADVENAFASGSGAKKTSTGSQKLIEAVKALAICHNVTPVYEEEGGRNNEAAEGDSLAEADQSFAGGVTYQASSPDEVSCNQNFFGLRNYS